jgi:hypothetical protein
MESVLHGYRGLWDGMDEAHLHARREEVRVFSWAHQRAVFRESVLRGEWAWHSATRWALTPRACATEWVREHRHKPYPPPHAPLRALYESRCDRQDRFFFEEVLRVLRRYPHTAPALLQSELLHAGHQWCVSPTPDRLSAWWLSLGGPVWQTPKAAVTWAAPLDDPVFLDGLGRTPFWTIMENATDRHPVWEALLEKHALLSLFRGGAIKQCLFHSLFLTNAHECVWVF